MCLSRRRRQTGDTLVTVLQTCALPFGYNCGADSAQLCDAGGYRFLHSGFGMAPSDAVLKWAEGVIKRYPGLPTIVSTHSFLNRAGERRENPAVDFKAVNPVHNNPQDVWDKFLSQNDQIFLMLSGHQYGQAHRVHLNRFGHKVYQVLSDYQGRDRKSTRLNSSH